MSRKRTSGKRRRTKDNDVAGRLPKFRFGQEPRLVAPLTLGAKRRPFTISFDGILAAGKTTLLNSVAEKLRDLGYRVAISEELTPRIARLLKKSYEEPSEFNSLVVQLAFQQQRMLSALECWPLADFILFDRHINSDMSFVYARQELGLMCREAVDTCRDNLNVWKLTRPVQTQHPDLTVWMSVDYDVALERIAKRARPGEEAVDENYLRVLSRWLERYKQEVRSGPGSLWEIETEEDRVDAAAIAVVTIVGWQAKWGEAPRGLLD